MGKIDSVTITSSNIIALWQLVLLTSKHEEITVKSAIEITLNSGLMGGGLPADQGLKLGQYCRILEINEEQKLYSSQYCKDKLIGLCETEEPNILVFRGILFRFVSFQNFDWLLFFNDDPEIFKTGIPGEWIDLLEQAELFNFTDLIVRDWWEKIFSKFQTYKEGQQIEVGKVAEKLSYEYERQRLESDGLDNGHFFVKWASQINDKYGYDILSIRGNFFKFTFEEKDSIQIEVKCSVTSNEREFRFYISKNEWNIALKNMGSYFFYCWTSASKERENANGPFIIPANKLSSHIPTDNGTVCEWSQCKFVVDLNSLSII